MLSSTQIKLLGSMNTLLPEVPIHKYYLSCKFYTKNTTLSSILCFYPFSLFPLFIYSKSLGFVVVFVICSVALTAVASAVNSVIVLFAEGPAKFESNWPELRKMRDAYEEARILREGRVVDVLDLEEHGVLRGSIDNYWHAAYLAVLKLK